ncbi:MAG: cysteine desulfurase family protein [Clostridia bacterium]|nr:cysteine desulfurase family protein [Clostridia bacterium]
MIYLDNAATTKPYDKVLEVLKAYNTHFYFNPSSAYLEGFEVKKAVNKARELLASLLGCNKQELYFTSGATEANNLFLQGVITSNKKDEYIFNLGEHSSVYEVANFIKSKGYTVHFAKLLPSGQVDLEYLKSLVNANTKLVSVMHISNETGAINDIKDIVRAVKSINSKTLIHCDGVQACGKINVNINNLGVDSYVVSSHKIHGPKGVGAIFVKEGVNIKPLILGGGQESGIRSGTENVAGIIAFSESAKLIIENMDANHKKVTALKNLFLENIKDKLSVKFNGLEDENSPYILSLSLAGIRGETLVHLLQKRGVIVNTGSSCSSNAKRAGNRVLEAIGLNKEEVSGSIRISFSEFNTEEEVIASCKIFIEEVLGLIKKVS